MRTRYITTDLDIEGLADLSLIVEEFGEEVVPHFCGIVGEAFRASFGIASCGSESGDINFYCTLIDSLSDDARELIETCTKIDFNLGYEAGNQPKSWRSILPNEDLERIASVGGDVVVTIYPYGTYSKTDDA